jgi:hypothetical protein
MIRDGVFFLRCFAALSAWVALQSLWRSLDGGVPMPPETHTSAMFLIPAEAWSLVSLAQAGLLFWLAGTRHYLWLAFVATIGATINLALSHFSSHAAFGFLQSTVTGGVGLLHCAVVVAAMVDALGCRIAAFGRLLLDRIVGRDE